MEEPRDEIMEEVFAHLPEERGSCHGGRRGRRPRKRSSSAREPVSKRSRSRESYIHQEEDSD